GRNNYACRQKIYDAEREPVLSGLEEIADYQVIREWEKTTTTGDRAEIRSLPEGSTAWAKLDARRELCSGQRCQQFERCFLTQMRQLAHASDIIIVNHHLFFADLAAKDDEFGGIIPDYAAVVFDEAHEIEDVAGQYFGINLSNHQFLDLTRDLGALARRKNFGSPEMDRILDTVRERVAIFFDSLPRTEGRSGFRGHAAFVEAHEREYRDVLHALELLTAHIELIRIALDELLPLTRRARELAGKLQFWMAGGNRSWVYWIERRGKGAFLQATPIDVSSLLHDKLFDRIDTVILTSATLAVSGGFDFTIQRLGLRHPRTLIVPSHFDYQRQALLYVPQHLPDPRSPGFTAEASDEIVRILNLSRGRAFALFTSYQQMRAVYDRAV
ncbi:MAG: ATP-dependent DNA helicase, partial [Bryobacteraceae bacterium]